MKKIVLALSVFVGSVFLLSDKVSASQIENPHEINFSVQNIDTGEYENENVEILTNKTYEVPSLRSSMITYGNSSEEKATFLNLRLSLLLKMKMTAIRSSHLLVMIMKQIQPEP